MNVAAISSAISTRSFAEPVPSTQPDRRALASAISTINESDVWPGRTLKIHLDITTHRLTVQVVNSETGEVVDQIPEEEVLRMALETGGRANSAANGQE